MQQPPVHTQETPAPGLVMDISMSVRMKLQRFIGGRV
jgi:hypothetical protein